LFGFPIFILRNVRNTSFHIFSPAGKTVDLIPFIFSMSGSKSNNPYQAGSAMADQGAGPHPALVGLNAAAAQFANVPGAQNQHKYSLLLATIEEIGKQIRPAHTGNKNATEQMKRHIAFAKLLIRELLTVVDHNLNQMASKERRDAGFSAMPPGPVAKKRPGTSISGPASGMMRMNWFLFSSKGFGLQPW
jgi:Cyclin-dependent kinase 2-associated protein